jgi:hypothetical protein
MITGAGPRHMARRVSAPADGWSQVGGRSHRHPESRITLK